VQQARELLEFLVHTQTEDGAFGLFLRSELQSILDRSPAALFHDELAENNHRFYLHEFLADAARYGLRYFSEARLSSFQAETLPAEVMDRISTLAHGDDREYDQYLDFLNAKIFRQNLLCRAELQPLRRVDTAQVIKMWASSDAQPASGHPDVSSTAAEEFQLPDGGKISSNHPITKAALLHLGSVWPKAVAVSELLRIARGLAGRHTEADAADDAAWLLQSLVKLYAAKFLELHMRPRSFTAEVSERPVASPLARAQIRMDAPVSNLACSSVALDDPIVRALMLLLDGTRNREQILSELRVLAGPVEITAEQLEVNLNRLATLAFLTA
jgi:methyltransferase-like protein